MKANQANNASGNDVPVQPASTWKAKVGYIGTGIAIGIVVYPAVRKVLTKLQPGLDGVFDNLTGKAEGLAERASDLLAKARDNLRQEHAADEHDHSHSHDHDHGHSHSHDHAHGRNHGPKST